MYGKFFASAFEGSMYGAGADVFALWSYVISHTINSRVEINPAAVAPKIGMEVGEVEKALAYLQREDPQSRSDECNGRRMVKEGQFSYFIPNHRVYLLIKKPEDLRAYNAKKKRESRERKKMEKLQVHGEPRRDGEMEEEKEAEEFMRKAMGEGLG